MTPKEIAKLKDGAQIRVMSVLAPSDGAKLIECDHYVEGYAARFEPYVLYELDDGPIYEKFEREAFKDCDMSDVIFQFDHEGRVLARQSNGSLVLRINEAGLFIAADLGRTDAARQIYEDITSGMCQRMSWRWRLGEYVYDETTRTIIHKTVKKIWDVSAVSIPANDKTVISARSWVDGVIDLARRSDRELEERRQRLRIQNFEINRRIQT